jgi:hypothetical protein
VGETLSSLFWIPSIILMGLLTIFWYFIWPLMGMPVLFK